MQTQFGIFAEEIGGRLVVLDQARNRIHHFNDTATLVWNCLHAGEHRENIVSKFCARYGIDADRARADIDQTVREFQRLKLIGRRH